jgi:membrane dipeptidase
MIDVFRRRLEGESDVLRRRHLPGLREGGVVACVCTCGGDVPALRPIADADPHTNAVALLDALRSDVAESKGAFAVVTSSADLGRCIDEGQVGLIPALEGASPIQGDLERLIDLYERGIRVVGLTWNSRNELAVGLDSGEGGLSPLGVRAIHAMNELGVIIDLAHAAETTFWDVARESHAPLVVTHANARGVLDHPRNLTDDQLDRVGSSGGVVGLCLYPAFVGTQPIGADMVVKHAAHMVNRIGIDGLVVGPDFIDYAVEQILGDLGEHGALYPADSFTYPVGLESARGLQLLMQALDSSGFDDGALHKVGIANFLRVYADAEDRAARSRVPSMGDAG